MNIKIFEQIFEGHNVIIQKDENGLLWFEIESLSMAIGYMTKANGKEYVHKTRMNKTLKNAEITPFVHGVQNFISEQQMYDFLIEAHTEKAKRFKKWLSMEVLPQIESTGGYIETDREAEFVDKYFPSFTEETKLSMVQDLRKQNEEYKKQIADLESKAQAYADLMTAQGYLQFIDVAALVEIGRNTLFQFLRKCKVLTKQSNYNIPYGRFTKNGMFKVITSRSEKGHISSVTMVSPKGLNYIYKLMKKKEVLDDFNTTALLQKIKDLEVA